MTLINKAEAIPTKKASQKYPFNVMAIGESFDLGEYTTEKMQKFSGYVWYYTHHKSQKVKNKTFVQRKVEVSKGKFILRCYRES